MSDEILNIRVVRAVEGFIVYEEPGIGPKCRKWAFETPKTLANFIEMWANLETETLTT